MIRSISQLSIPLPDSGRTCAWDWTGPSASDNGAGWIAAA